ncbi:MAG: ribosomal protein S18-alanine N-acetyltransferase [Desulfobacterales bacterium]
MSAPGVSIAALAEGHIDEIITIEMASFKQPWLPMSFYDELSSTDALDIVALHPRGRQVLGYACMRLVLDEINLLKIAVAPYWRRKNVGTRLLDNCLRLAHQKGAKKAYLEVRRSNWAARNFYWKFGFRLVGTRPGYYLDTGEDALSMMKTLEETK